jgi:trimeric autotransporter adhesin
MFPLTKPSRLRTGLHLKIALSTADDKVTAPVNIRGIYVVLDKANAVESAPSELNAWNSYDNGHADTGFPVCIRAVCF